MMITRQRQFRFYKMRNGIPTMKSMRLTERKKPTPEKPGTGMLVPRSWGKRTGSYCSETGGGEGYHRSKGLEPPDRKDRRRPQGVQLP
ncbi:hypothetical protein U1Q18_045606 [Sarracenia purpurea var. burkii]